MFEQSKIQIFLDISKECSKSTRDSAKSTIEKSFDIVKIYTFIYKILTMKQIVINKQVWDKSDDYTSPSDCPLATAVREQLLREGTVRISCTGMIYHNSRYYGKANWGWEAYSEFSKELVKNPNHSVTLTINIEK